MVDDICGQLQSRGIRSAAMHGGEKPVDVSGISAFWEKKNTIRILCFGQSLLLLLISLNHFSMIIINITNHYYQYCFFIILNGFIEFNRVSCCMLVTLVGWLVGWLAGFLSPLNKYLSCFLGFVFLVVCSLAHIPKFLDTVAWFSLKVLTVLLFWLWFPRQFWYLLVSTACSKVFLACFDI